MAAPCVRGSDAERAIDVAASDGARLDAQLAEGGGHDAAFLAQQRPQQVLGRHLRVVALLGLRSGRR